MKKALLLLLLPLTAAAELPADYHVPTKADLVTSFTESFQRKLQKAPEYYGHDKLLLERETFRNTVTPQDIEKVAEFTANALKRQEEICHQLLVKYPKAKGASCVNAVLMVNGLGHADDQRSIMEMLQDKEQAAQMKEQFENSADAKSQVKYATDTLSAGPGKRIKHRDAEQDMQATESALGLVALQSYMKEAMAAAIAK